MQTMKRIWIIGISLIGGAIITTPASAQIPNQSDITGTNIWNSTVPRLGSGSRLDPEIIKTAQRISKDIDDAYTACAASAQAAAKLPRRFALNPDTLKEVCNSPECQNLTRLVEEAKTFVNSLDSIQTQNLKASGSFQIW